MRKSGILLPISSLDSKYGIGTFSKNAYKFVDFLREAGQSYWQVLPLGPTGYGDSPYQSFSTFAGNPYFIDFDQLIEEGYLTSSDLKLVKKVDNEEYVDYGYLYSTRYVVLKKAFDNSDIEEDSEFKTFEKENEYWLDDYALYMAIKDKMNGICWTDWEDEYKLRDKTMLAEFSESYRSEIIFYKFQQYIFHKQWISLKEYANEKGVKIIGDIPIYVAFDSADTWSNPELYQFDENCQPIAVAGCPPDAFSATGQLWGNPLFDWKYHKETNFKWWLDRIAHCNKLYDVIRIDHFRGFDEYYSIPFGNETAENGEWKKGPGIALFNTIRDELGDIDVIAEDLGFLTDTVIELVEKTGYPGMKVLQFAFDPREESDYLPHNYENNCVVYTGTHDNDTILGWYNSIAKSDQKFAKDYLGVEKDEEIEWAFIRAAYSSVAGLAIIPLQDYLGLGQEARINIPSTLGLNWKWRLKKGALTKSLAKRINKLTTLYSRL